MEFLGGVRGKSVCVLASGDNEVAFALAGMGAKVTSVDISEGQLKIAEKRAGILGLVISFLRGDVTDLREIEDQTFDLVHSGGGVWIWISDIRQYCAEAVRILRRRGLLVVNDAHPFSLLMSDGIPWADLHSYYDRGPLPYETTEGMPACEHFWTVSDQIQAALDAGCDLLKVAEHDGTAGDRIQQELDRKEEDDEGVKDTQFPKLPRQLLIVGRKR
jgi:ubiquinone/menaquinone biosynthesis C-methylase UbiE